MQEPEIGNIADLERQGMEESNAPRVRSIVSWVFFALALLYGASPLDLIPDAVPLVGWLDDAGLILAAALNIFQKNYCDQKSFLMHFVKYSKWILLLATFFVIVALGGLIAFVVWVAGVIRSAI